MTAPIPVATARPRRVHLRVLPAPDPEPPYDPDPYWERPRLRAVPDQLPIEWAGRARPGRGDATPPHEPPGARRAAWLLVNGYLDVLRGRRRAEQLAATAIGDGADQLRQVRPRPGRRVRLHGLYVVQSVPGKAEVVVTLGDAGRISALTIQLVRHGNGWRCAHFQML
jgi:hypothetical protein